MGYSAVLLKKEFLELSLEIDKSISLEMGTGFGSGERAEMHVNMPITLDELKLLIDELYGLHDSLSKAWKCPQCGTLVEHDKSQCDDCDFIDKLKRL